jgi:uncharacterized protein
MTTDRNGMAVLSEAECFARIGRNGIGRVGLNIGALPAILPVMYAVHDGDVYFRSSRGAKLTAASNHAVIAFEVDDSDCVDHSGWSVMIVGQAELVLSEGDREAERLPLLRWVPGGGDDDVLVRVRPQLVSGRCIETTKEATNA